MRWDDSPKSCQNMELTHPQQGFVSRWDLGASSPLQADGAVVFELPRWPPASGCARVCALLNSRVNETTQQPPPSLTRHPQLAIGLREITPRAGKASSDSYMTLK